MVTDARRLTQPLTLGLALGEHQVPPSWFYQVPRVDDYWGTVAAMLLDDQIASALQLRKRTALSFPWRWSEATSQAARALLQEQMSRLTLEHDLMDALACLEQGVSYCEQVWEQVAGRWLIARIEARDPARFRWHRDGTLLAQGPDLQWAPVPPYRVAAFTHRATRENPYGVSVLEPCYPRWQGKWKAMAQLERLGEKFAIPSVLALTDASDDGELARVSAALAALEHGAGVALSGVREVVTLAASGSAADLLKEVEAADAAISRVITGQVLALDKGDTGSYAMSKTHQHSLESVALLDFRALLRKFSRTTLAWVLELNGVPGPAELVVDEDALKAQQAAAQAGASGAATGAPARLADPGRAEPLLQMMV